MKRITQFSVNNPVTVSMLVLGILLLGYISFSKLGIDLLPDMNSPRIFVEINAGERPPEEIEKLFVENIESQAIRQKGVAQVSSVCMVGSARITVEYNWGTDMDEAFLDLQKALTTYSQNSDIDEFNIIKINVCNNPEKASKYCKIKLKLSTKKPAYLNIANIDKFRLMPTPRANFLCFFCLSIASPDK